MASSVSRRGFLKAAGAVTASAYAVNSLPTWASSPSLKGSVAITPALSTFPYSDVQLFGGALKRQFEENHARFLNLEDDRLLKVFRQVAGLAAPGEDMGGWYDLNGFSLVQNEWNGFIAGHSFGQYLSGLHNQMLLLGLRDSGSRLRRQYS